MGALSSIPETGQLLTITTSTQRKKTQTDVTDESRWLLLPSLLRFGLFKPRRMCGLLFAGIFSAWLDVPTGVLQTVLCSRTAPNNKAVSLDSR